MPQDGIPRPETPSTIRISFLKEPNLGAEFFDSVKKPLAQHRRHEMAAWLSTAQVSPMCGLGREVVATRVWKGSACDAPIGGEMHAMAG